MGSGAAGVPGLRLRRRARVWLALRSGWIAERVGRREYLRHPDWRDGWGGVFNGQEFRQRIFAEVAACVPFAAIVETGTYRGTTTEYFRRLTRVPIHSFEAHPRHYGYACARLRGLSGIHVYRGDSRAGLARLAEAGVLADGPVFFYLDAHGFGELPLVGEVALAFRHWPRAVVMIDDFAVPDDPGYAFDDFGGGQALTLAYLERCAVLPAGIWFPSCPAAAETGARRGCVVLAGDADVVRMLDSLPTLRRWAR